LPCFCVLSSEQSQPPVLPSLFFLKKKPSQSLWAWALTSFSSNAKRPQIFFLGVQSLRQSPHWCMQSVSSRIWTDSHLDFFFWKRDSHLDCQVQRPSRPRQRFSFWWVATKLPRKMIFPKRTPHDNSCSFLSSHGTSTLIFICPELGELEWFSSASTRDSFIPGSSQWAVTAHSLDCLCTNTLYFKVQQVGIEEKSAEQNIFFPSWIIWFLLCNSGVLVNHMPAYKSIQELCRTASLLTTLRPEDTNSGTRMSVCIKINMHSLAVHKLHRGS